MTNLSIHTSTAKFAGFALLALSFLSLLFIAHHPTLGTPGFETLADEAAEESHINGFVHGALIIITAGFYICLSIFADSLNNGYFLVRAGKISLAFATLSMIGAALVSGFIVPDTARSLLSASAADEFEPLLRMLGATNRLLAEAGVVAYGAAMLFWSVRLVRMNGFARISAIIGVIAGVVLAGGIVSGQLHLNVQGMTLALTIMCAWFVTAAIVMIRNDAKA